MLKEDNSSSYLFCFLISASIDSLEMTEICFDFRILIACSGEYLEKRFLKEIGPTFLDLKICSQDFSISESILGLFHFCREKSRGFLVENVYGTCNQ